MKILLNFRKKDRPIDHPFWGELIELDTLKPDLETCYKIQSKLFVNAEKVHELAGINYCILLDTLIEFFKKRENYELCHFNNKLLNKYISSIYEKKNQNIIPQPWAIISSPNKRGSLKR